MMAVAMNVWNFLYRDASWMDASGEQAMRYVVDASSFFFERALLRSELRRAQAELDDLWPPMPDTADLASPGWGIFQWFQFTARTSVQLPHSLTVTSELIEEWQQWWQRFHVRIERLQETIKLVRQRSRLLDLAISLLLEVLTFPRFPYQLIRRERAWCLLHGSHPPKQDAGICRPAFVELGRVCCEQVC